MATSNVDDCASDTTSIASSVCNYRFENGRRYHAYKDGSYWGPNDEKAQEHLDIAHHLWLKTLDDKLHLAPLPSRVSKVLDIGCGTGLWAIEFAERNPTAQVIGTDLSPTQPTCVPSNCRFELDDASDEWTYAPNSFDFIHIRSLFGCIASWPTLYARALRCLKPGGYIEHVEMAHEFKSPDDSIPAGSAMASMASLSARACAVTGKPGDVIYRMKDWMGEAGFKDVKQVEYVWPNGQWPADPKLKEIGRWSRLHLLHGSEDWTLALATRALGWEVAKARAFIDQLRESIKDPKIHAYHDMFVTFARRPTD
ncbi:S-adenosyl-L-methionine-dependent methyltransferase [Phyllosticta citrichinensis]|uniref:S-adenosyl-L-methionine-dependent methyltransferase n=1 Tax=Phyllosticta citrichinensis TaxID=1130410 RepID=A0ABR1XSB4_9PEZI